MSDSSTAVGVAGARLVCQYRVRRWPLSRDKRKVISMLDGFSPRSAAVPLFSSLLVLAPVAPVAVVVKPSDVVDLPICDEILYRLL